MSPAAIPRILGLFRSPAALSSLLDEIPLAVAVLDRQRRVLAINRWAEALPGLARDEACGIPCHHVLRTNFCVQGCDLLRMDAESEPVCREGNLLNRDRRKIPVRITMAPVKDLQGELAGFVEAL